MMYNHSYKEKKYGRFYLPERKGGSIWHVNQLLRSDDSMEAADMRLARNWQKNLDWKDKKTLRGWVAKVQRGESLEDGEVRQRTSTRGKSRTKFSSLEEKLAYLEAERDYLKNCIAPGSGTNGERTKKLLLQDNWWATGTPSAISFAIPFRFV